MSKLPINDEHKFSLKSLKKIFSYFLPDAPELIEIDYIRMISHAIKFKNSYERNTVKITISPLASQIINPLFFNLSHERMMSSKTPIK
jgi:hypothetical protein